MTVPSHLFVLHLFGNGFQEDLLPSPCQGSTGLCLATSYFLEVGLTRPFKDSCGWPRSDICQLSAPGDAAHQALWIYRCPSCFKCSLSGSSSTEGKSSLLWAFSLKGFPAFSHCLLLFSPIFFFFKLGFCREKFLCTQTIFRTNLHMGSRYCHVWMPTIHST